jgi:hypothetical protein
MSEIPGQSGHALPGLQRPIRARSGHPVDTSRPPAVGPRKPLPSTKSGFFQPFEHKILRLLCAELSGERPGVKELP